MMRAARLVSGAVALGLLGCGDASKPPEAGTADSSAAGVIMFAAPDGSFDVALPARWSGHYLVDSLSTQERGRARPGALVFAYVPSDTSIVAQALVVVAVYDAPAWAAVRAEGGPPPGDSVAAKNGLVFVVALPQSNPFPANSTDQVLFHLLQLRAAEVASLVHPR